ncbi:hypothetical protein DFH08DRAFT_486808 [Mycena albidolilacea]|uniref:F-box domain-containing protein n=1 Tax=Mycena albidolilacea TaxID=1033008 RepID=A0AAD6Z5M6_9AGAR|nr:hypothetical protein DFH08DRAFT_486808 [Mycena albidolilacea]
MNLESCWQCGASPEAATVSQKSRPSFHNLFTSNDVPLESETSYIRDIVSDGQDQIDALNVQIAKMEAAITRLTQRRDAIGEHVSQHRVILSPVRRVPPELICEILALSVSGDDDEVSMDKPQLHIRQICGLNKPPWHLGLICRSWRRTVLGYPTLWCSIILPSSSPFPSDHHSLLLMIETQLVRSAEAPLRVCWASNQHEDSPDLDAVTLLLAHSSRWRVLGVFCRGVKLDWLNAARGSLPALETLAVIGGEAEIPDIFLTAPSLRRVFLTDWHHQPSWSVPKIPWAQITYYAESFTADSQVERLHSLQTAPNLVSCAISLSYWTDSYQPGVLTVLPRLQRLRVVEAEFLQHLKAPLLQELFFWNNTGQDGWSEIVPFVERSACSLQKLCLMGGSVDSNLITVLGGLQSVTHLIIHDNAWDNELEQIDLFDGLFKYLCPNLTYLAFGFGAKFATGHFLAIAESRFRLEPPQLRLFRTYNKESEDCPSDTAVAIQSMCDQGFDVAFIGSHRAGIFQGKDFFYSL